MAKHETEFFSFKKLGKEKKKKEPKMWLNSLCCFSLLAIAALGSKTSSKSQKDYSHFVLRLKMAEYNFSFSLFLSLSLYVCMPGLLA